MSARPRRDPPTCPSCLGAHRRGEPHYPPIHEPEAPPSLAPASPLALAAHATIASALTLTHGNIRRAASLLGLSASALHRRLARSPETQAWHRATFPRSLRQPPRHAKRKR